MQRRFVLGVVSAALLALAAGAASANSVTISGTGTGGRSADVSISVASTTANSTTLQLVLRNTSNISGKMDASDILTGLLINTSAAVMKPVANSALVDSNAGDPTYATLAVGKLTDLPEVGSTGYYSIGDYWVFEQFSGTQFGVAASGYNLFSVNETISGRTAPKPGSANGGIVGTGFSSLNSSVKDPTVASQIIFSITVGSGNFDPQTQIASAEFIYGTGNKPGDSHFAGPNVTPVPLPDAAYSGFALLAGLGGFAAVRRKLAVT